jgi:DNA-binding beta-propeller fold protein YncE
MQSHNTTKLKPCSRYFAISQAKSEIWVGDRANNRLVVLKMIGCELVMDGYVSTPAGLFHSMITQRGDVDYPIAATTCDIDNVIIVHDLTTRRELAVMERPQEAIDAGAKPHDVTTNGDYIFVTFLGTADGAGYVASYDTVTFELVSVLETAADPHVAIRGDTDLFIAAQGGVVYKVSVPDLTILSSTDRPSPHGMIVSFDSKYMYTTNIGEGGDMAIDNWDVGTGAKMDCPDVTTTWPTPHNPTISFNGKYLYITHSGGDSTKNSRFHIGHDGCVDPHSEYVFDTNLNPFGLFVVAPAAPLLTCRNA